MLYGKLYLNVASGIEVRITTPARKLLGPHKEIELVKGATELADCLGAKQVWVCRRWNSLEITFVTPQGLKDTMRIQP